MYWPSRILRRAKSVEAGVGGFSSFAKQMTASAIDTAIIGIDFIRDEARLPKLFLLRISLASSTLFTDNCGLFCSFVGGLSIPKGI